MVIAITIVHTSFTCIFTLHMLHKLYLGMWQWQTMSEQIPKLGNGVRKTWQKKWRIRCSKNSFRHLLYWSNCFQNSAILTQIQIAHPLVIFTHFNLSNHNFHEISVCTRLWNYLLNILSVNKWDTTMFWSFISETFAS